MPVVGRVLGFISPRWRQPSACEACGNDFTCGASLTGCWCLAVKLSDAARADLRTKYTKCICRACLEEAARRGS
jgi:hypothetical protein